MARATEPKKPAAPKARSADEMRDALNALAFNREEQAIPPHYDEPAIILDDAINELLELRQLRADVLAFSQQVQPKLARK